MNCPGNFSCQFSVFSFQWSVFSGQFSVVSWDGPFLRGVAWGTALLSSCGRILLSTFSDLLSMAWRPSPPHPRPLSPVSRGRGEDFVFFVVVRGRVGRAKLLLSRTSFEHSGGSAGASPSHGCGSGTRIRCRLQGDFPPHPRPLSPVSRGRGEDFVFFVVVKGHVGRAKLLLSRTRLTECPAAAE